jgi:hypothetical protein
VTSESANHVGVATASPKGMDPVHTVTDEDSDITADLPEEVSWTILGYLGSGKPDVPLPLEDAVALERARE